MTNDGLTLPSVPDITSAAIALQTYLDTGSARAALEHAGPSAIATLTAARARGELHPDWWPSILRTDPCAYCGRPAETVDHITARHEGGHDDAGNLTGACRPCNSAKGTKPLLQILNDRRRP